MIWQLKIDGAFVDMPTPQAYSIDGEDLDLDSYRSVVNGNLIRNILGFKWQKAQFEFAFKYEDEAADLINKVANTYPLTIKCKSPILSTSGLVELTGYVSQIKCEYKSAILTDGTFGGGYVVSFNFVEGTR